MTVSFALDTQPACRRQQRECEPRYLDPNVNRFDLSWTVPTDMSGIAGVRYTWVRRLPVRTMASISQAL